MIKDTINSILEAEAKADAIINLAKENKKIAIVEADKVASKALSDCERDLKISYNDFVKASESKAEKAAQERVDDGKKDAAAIAEKATANIPDAANMLAEKVIEKWQ